MKTILTICIIFSLFSCKKEASKPKSLDPNTKYMYTCTNKISIKNGNTNIMVNDMYVTPPVEAQFVKGWNYTDSITTSSCNCVLK